MTKTKIEWADRVWNPITGCEKVSAGCAHCYAERIARRFWKDRKFTDVRIHPERLREPLHWRKPQRIFVNSMSDLFHERVYDNDESFIDEVFAVAAACPQHTFMILTKRSGIMRNYFNHPRRTMYVESALEWLYEGRIHMMPELVWPLPNVWPGVSVENQRTADERIPLLLQTPAAVRFVSCEPLLGPVDLTEIMESRPDLPDGVYGKNSIKNALKSPEEHLFWTDNRPRLDWVIVGGESGPGARPMHPDWVRDIRDQCLTANVPLFFKQWGEWQFVMKDYEPNHVMYERVGKKKAGRELDGMVWDEFPWGSYPRLNLEISVEE